MCLACLGGGLLQPACTFPEYTFAEGTGGGSDGVTGGQAGSDGGGGAGGSGGSGGATGGSGGSGGSGSVGTGGGGGAPAPTCDDDEKNGDETDVDCGGECPGCQAGQECDAHEDCATNSCNPFSDKCEPSLKIECRCVNCQATLQTSSQVIFRLVNDGRQPLNLEEFKVRYYYDQNLDETATCTSAPFVGGCAQVIENHFPVEPAVTGADRYVEVTFTSSSGQLGNTDPTGELTLTFTPSSNGAFDQQDDYSWVASDSFVSCNKWTAWRISSRDVLVFGAEPN